MMEPDKPPLHGFFVRAEALATAAFLTLPCVGDGLAEFFNKVVVPACSPPRDRAIRMVFRAFKPLEGWLQIVLLRLLPLPKTRPPK
jgi:hypothetical protein